MLDFAEESEKRKKKLSGKFLGANMHTADIQNYSEQVCTAKLQILMITKIYKTEKSAEILKRKKIIVFIIRITPKTNQHMCRVWSFP